MDQCSAMSKTKSLFSRGGGRGGGGDKQKPNIQIRNLSFGGRSYGEK